MARKVSRFDWLIYRLFFWRWGPILNDRPDLAKKMGLRIMMFSVRK